MNDLNNLRRENAAELAEFTSSIKETQEADQTLDANLNAGKQDAQSGDRLEEEAKGNPFAAAVKSAKLPRKEELKTEKAKNAQESVLVRKEEADELAGEFSQRQGNREYHLDILALSSLISEDLGAAINEDAEPDEIIGIVRARMSVNGEDAHVAMVDKAFEFLLEVTRNKANVAAPENKNRFNIIFNRIESAKLKHFEANKVTILVSEKIIGAVDATVEKTGAGVKETLDRYSDWVHNPPELQTLRKEFESKGYKVMVKELKALSAFLGGLIKDTSKENPELIRIAQAVRKMQALWNVFKLTNNLCPTMEHYCEVNRVFEIEVSA